MNKKLSRPISNNNLELAKLKNLKLPKFKTIFISAFPKSGSSYLLYLLHLLSDYEVVRLDYSHLNEQNLYLPAIIENRHKNTITKHHTLPTPANIELFKRFDIRPIILTRNIFDTIISLRDHIIKHGKWNTFVVPKDYRKLSSETQIDLLIDFAVPWYVSFFAGWKLIEQQQTLPTLLLSYHQIIKRLEEVVNMINIHTGINLDSLSLSEAIKILNKEQRITKKNIGIEGRGKLHLNHRQIENITRLTSYYPTIDFLDLGI